MGPVWKEEKNESESNSDEENHTVIIEQDIMGRVIKEHPQGDLL